ncbi:hypothetical protein [Virgibacillus sediminis]|uniref:Uncharacterized protein n=1 Tax=Virgibacillus sediminis TaxID=202260 RepID=A0ABV7A608_9BACI
MQFYSKEGLVEGYKKDNVDTIITMAFIVDGMTLLELGITQQATVSPDSGVDQGKVYHWLWEQGNEIILRESFNYGTKVTITASDVKNGNIVTYFENLKKENI